MTYTTNLKSVRVAGTGVDVVNEIVGTGDNSTTSYDLDHGNVISGSYTLSYAASGSNDLTALTETTHYTLDKDGGLIELTTAGKTALGTNILYATYTHFPDISDTILSSWLDSVDEEVNKLTNNYWGSATSETEYFDGRRSDNYPTTDRPYAKEEWDEPDYVQLKYKNILSLTGAYFLTRGSSLGDVQRYDSTLTTYTDVTAEANTLSGTAFQPFGTTTANGDYLYIGSQYKFRGLDIINFTLGVTSGTNTIEYYDGSSWTAFTATESTTGVLNFAANGSLSWDDLSSWTKVSVNSGTSLYFVRIVANTTYTTEAKVNHIAMSQDSVIGTEIPLYALDYNLNGRVTFLNNRLPNGTRNVRIDYTHGYTSTPELVVELASQLMALRMFVALLGGSYDTPTSYQLPEGQIQIGQIYVNVAEVVKQTRNRIDEIVSQLGSKKMFLC